MEQQHERYSNGSYAIERGLIGERGFVADSGEPNQKQVAGSVTGVTCWLPWRMAPFRFAATDPPRRHAAAL